jgi:hypothetical protein
MSQNTPNDVPLSRRSGAFAPNFPDTAPSVAGFPFPWTYEVGELFVKGIDRALRDPLATVIDGEQGRARDVFCAVASAVNKQSKMHPVDRGDVKALVAFASSRLASSILNAPDAAPGLRGSNPELLARSVENWIWECLSRKEHYRKEADWEALFA